MSEPEESRHHANTGKMPVVLATDANEVASLTRRSLRGGNN